VRLENFLARTGTDKHLTELILFFGNLAQTVKKGFFIHTFRPQNTRKAKNIFGEKPRELDKYADSVFVDGLKKKRLARYLATEEQGQIIEIENPKNDFGIVIDPIDGSSLIDVNLTLGSIIGIYPSCVLEKGSKMIGALYILYGPLTTLTFTVGNGVHEFAIDNNGQFTLRTQNLKISDGKIYSPGALRKDYLPAHEKWIKYLEQAGYTLRYSGCFVADIHQILHKGGVFTYPGFKGREKGKIKLLFEANPMGKIIHEAGGSVSNGRSNILDITPRSIADTTPVYIGGKKEINSIQKLMTE